jgi:hypothetical protein
LEPTVKISQGNGRCHNAQDPRSHRVHPRASRQRPHQCLSSALWEVQAQRVSLGQQIGWPCSNFARFGTQLVNLCDGVDINSSDALKCQPHTRRVRCGQCAKAWRDVCDKSIVVGSCACACARMCVRVHVCCDRVFVDAVAR